MRNIVMYAFRLTIGKMIEMSFLDNYKRVVIKIGSSTLTHAETGSLNFSKMERLVRSICDYRNSGMDVCLVSSGAIAVGRDVMTKNTIVNPVSRRNVMNTFEELFDLNVVPIVNENDTVSTYEMQFGDNDTLSAIVTSITKADLLILLSDIDGLYSDDPHDNPDAKLIREVDTLDRRILGMAKSSTGSDVGTGGMATKLTAAKIATYSGADMIIANGGNMGILYDIMNDRYTGTLFHRAKDAEFVLADYIQREMAPTSTGGQ